MVIKNIKIIATLVSLIVTGLLIYSHYYISALFLVLCFYILNEVLWADHIRYNVQEDQLFSFSSAEKLTVYLEKNKLSVPEKFQNGDFTILLSINLKSNFFGYIFDPFISIGKDNDSLSNRQYFERGAKGSRYLNISHSFEVGQEQLSLFPKYCKLTGTKLELIAFKNPCLKDKKILVMSPHPDDSEIAAYGLYSSNQSMVVTVTAGESEADSMFDLTGKEISPGRIKGELRVFDSVTVPLWAGLPSRQAINLGYFDGTLKEMFENPERSVRSTSANLDNTKVFRSFNKLKLSTDADCKSSWGNLIRDCSEVISNYRPDIIVTPHPELDSHSDHHYTTIAVQKALEESNTSNIELFYYVNHLKRTDQWPFGPSGSLTGLPPENSSIDRFFSFSLSREQQVKKSCALEMMHDLRTSPTPKKYLRILLQEKLIKRKKSYFGSEGFYRRGVKSNEVFFRTEFKSK
ncbi:PIG-L family deacetylase [Endozoicomonas sp. 4G]|uniref:PIG-L family deacetylase n=1 Tax=Endozoicomonas sp. 4G TaxID=2872754 RepID=UPI002078FED0|nr:PIG-L family deacetylase [Endozoicomonas sp. 4G]